MSPEYNNASERGGVRGWAAALPRRGRAFRRRVAHDGLVAASAGSLLSRLNRLALSAYTVAWRARSPRVAVERFGSAYGGWWLPPAMLAARGVCYCAGVGEDTSLEETLLRQTDCLVWSFDPTPQAVAHVASRRLDTRRFTFVPIGVWDRPGIVRLFEPRDFQNDVSHSIVNLRRTARYFEAECTTVSALMRQLGHDRLSLLKLNIEGAEWAVLENLLVEPAPIAILCVEFCQPAAIWRVAAMVRRLRRAGYSYLAHRGWKFTFARTD